MVRASTQIPAWTAASLALPTAEEKNRTKNTAGKSIIFALSLIIYKKMSYHRYVLQAPPQYTKKFGIFPANQCVFITYEESASLFRGAYPVPTLAGTQDYNFVDSEEMQKLYLSQPKTNMFNQVQEIRDGTKNLLIYSEIMKNILNKFPLSGANTAKTIEGKSRKDIFPFALQRKIKFAGVSSFNKDFPLSTDGLVEVECMVQGVATIFPRPDPDKIPVCERYVPGEINEAHIPVYSNFDQIEKIKIGRIIDFPNPHSMRVVVDISKQNYKFED